MAARRPFSERMGFVTVVVQTDGMNAALRSSLWNLISETLYLPDNSTKTWRSVQAIADAILGVPIQRVDYGSPVHWLLGEFEKLPWNRAYDALEYVVDNATSITNGRLTTPGVVNAANRILEREHSGFRFVGGELTRIMHPAESADVERARTKATEFGLEGVAKHIDQALALFGKRPDPDHRNAIKEAISAVEAVVKLIQGVRGGGLKGALDALATRIEIHAALRDGLVKLYGFTSDEDGIRHPILEKPNVGEEDARFMIVACSAAVNWIIAKAERAGVLKSPSRRGTASSH